MKAVVMKGPGKIEVVDVNRPGYSAEDVLVKVKCCGICGSDLHGYSAGPGDSSFAYPVFPGHEFSGEICDVGKNVKDFARGDAITARPYASCRGCYYCNSGDPFRCDKIVTMGSEQMSGAMAEFISIFHDQIHVLPEGLGFTEGALVEPLAVALHAIRKVESLNKIMIVGAGPIGVLALQVAKSAGAEHVIVTDIIDSRLELASSLGADYAFNSKDHDIVSQIRNVTDGLGPDAAFEAVGKPEALKLCLDSIKKTGKVCVIGVFPKPIIDMNIMKIEDNEYTLTGSYGFSRNEFQEAIEMIRKGKVDVKSLVTHTFPLVEAATAFDTASRRDTHVMKVHLQI